MRLPYLTDTQKSRDVLNVHKGLNMTLMVQDGEYASMGNMTGDYFPVLSPRRKRRICHTFERPHGIYGKNKLLWVDGTSLYYNGARVGTVEDNDKTFIGMAAYVVILPDKIILNTHDLTMRSMNHSFSTVGRVTYTLTDINGIDYVYTEGISPPEQPTNGQYWLDINLSPPLLKQYAEYTGAWVLVGVTYVKISAIGIGVGFNDYDGVNISGAYDEKFNRDFIVKKVNADYIVVQEILDKTQTQETPLLIKREAPDMDFITECNNRLWGCSSAKHEVYCSKLGDPYNWKAYEGLATDAYAATIGSDGDFTGLAAHMGYVLFFKENAIHKVMNVNPPFQISEIPARGVQKGSEKSLCTVGEHLFYKAINDVMIYSGAIPTPISEALGRETYNNAIGGSDGSKYYVSMQDANDTYHMFVYDLSTGMWHREDNTHARWFTRCLSDSFYVGTDNRLYAITNNDVAKGFVNGTEELNFGWFVETGDVLATTPDYKYVSKVQMRLEMDAGSSVKVWFLYDSTGEWEERFIINNNTVKKSYTIPIIPRRCDHYRMRITGIGDVRIYTVSKVLAQGSELI